MGTIRYLLNLRVALWGFAILLGLFGAGNVFVALFVSARFEVTYQLDFGVSHCVAERCAFSAMLEVANTGREIQPEVVVTLIGWPRGMGGSPRTINLDASFPRSGDPVVVQEEVREGHLVRLRELSPGALTQVRFTGMISRESLSSVAATQVRIEGRGRMVESDPRSLAFGRWFTWTGPKAPWSPV